MPAITVEGTVLLPVIAHNDEYGCSRKLLEQGRAEVFSTSVVGTAPSCCTPAMQDGTLPAQR